MLTPCESVIHVTVRCMPITEAGGAAKLVVPVNVEVPGLAPVAPPPLHILLAGAVAILNVTQRLIVRTALWQATTGLAPEHREVPEVVRAPVALEAGDSRLAVALALGGAVERLRSHDIAIASI